MAKRTMFIEMVHAPWWMGMIVGMAFLAVAGYALPAILSQDTMAGAALPGFQLAVIGAAGFCFLAAAVSLVRQLWQGRLVNSVGGGRALSSLDWKEFEHLLAGAFRRQGYQVMDNPPEPDGGIDLRLRKDEKRTYVQAKHWRNRKVGVRPVRELAGVVKTAGVEAGIVVSSIGFTREARQFAASAGIELVGPEQLHRWFRRQGLATHPEAAEDPVDAPICRRCQVAMVQRVARRGSKTGSVFWGCPNYPQCRVIAGIERC